jgi:hypothetical protein
VPVEDEPNDEVQLAAVAAPSRLTPQEQRNRSRMLDKVEAFWVKGVLEQSLYQIARLELGFDQAPAQVRHPWETVLHQPNRPNQPIPDRKSIVYASSLSSTPAPSESSSVASAAATSLSTGC